MHLELAIPALPRPRLTASLICSIRVTVQAGVVLLMQAFLTAEFAEYAEKNNGIKRIRNLSYSLHSLIR